jgi:putative thioredoxin
MNFDNVLARSHDKPVVVDFWAPWCGPCRVLGPTIEQLAEEQTDRWELVKVNTEEEQEIAQQYRIMSIPNVKMFYKGEEIAEFTGALPRFQIEQWLDEHLPDDRKEELAALLQQLQTGSDDKVMGQLEALVTANPDLKEGAVALAGQLVFADPTRALDLIRGIDLGDQYYDQADAIRQLAQFIQTDVAGDTPAAQAMADAQQAAKQQDWEGTIQHIIKATMIDKSFASDLPRKTAIAFFHTWGDTHPLTKKYRKRFDMALY